ncbi:MAG: hypothetical protein IJ747_00885 [Lachnospiraceae bacterium]|nr:hypothetical protein [Lachnospiraceae bacterium]
MNRSMVDGNGKEHTLQYLVLSTSALKQRQLAGVLSSRFPKERGCIFIPEREYWIRKTQSLGTKPLFPGYLFAVTDMSPAELHLFVRQNSREIQTFTNELSWKEMKDSGSLPETEAESWIELTESEAEFFDCMLDDAGIERMSVGYKEGNRYVVLEGPLKGWEQHIISNVRHDREARLDVAFREQQIVVGLIQKDKKDFFPEEKEDESTLVLEDKTEVKLDELSQQMMGNGIKDM